MKRCLAPERAATALMAGWLLLATGPSARAQEKPTLDPETVAILGDPGAGQADLDANVIEILGRPEGAPPPESAVGGTASAIDAKLRCPVCQGVSIADSPSGMATNMRAQVRELVAKGYSEEQVLSYFERSYGEFVRLEPPLRGLNMMLWFLPAAVLLGGAVFVFMKARRRTPLPEAAAASSETAAPTENAVDPELAKYLDRIRRDSGGS